MNKIISKCDYMLDAGSIFLASSACSGCVQVAPLHACMIIVSSSASCTIDLHACSYVIEGQR